MEIKDYLHLYIGQQVIHKQLPHLNGKLMWLQPGEHFGEQLIAVVDNGSYSFVEIPIQYIQPILRPLSDMTEEERLKYGWTMEDTDEGLKVTYPFESFRLLCKDGWDLFGLIPAGLAIDKTSLI